jgi:hypothetical protein
LDSAFSLPSISQILPDPITHNLFQPRCTSGLVPGLRVGQHINAGDPLLVLDKHYGGGGLNDLFLDIAFRNGSIVQNPAAKPVGYFSYIDLISDGLANLPATSYKIREYCEGNPAP